MSNPITAVRQLIRRLYAWTVGWAQTKMATRALAGIAFAESSFFPIPPDPLLIAMTTVKPKAYLKYAAICTGASVIGGFFGYFIGITLMDGVGQRVIDFYHLNEAKDEIGRRYNDNAFLTIATAGFTPIPYKLITIAAGAFRVNLIEFLAASIIGRGARFFLVAFLMHHFGERFGHKIERYIDVLGVTFIVLLVLGFVAIRFVF